MALDFHPISFPVAFGEIRVWEVDVVTEQAAMGGFLSQFRAGGCGCCMQVRAGCDLDTMESDFQ